MGRVNRKPSPVGEVVAAVLKRRGMGDAGEQASVQAVWAKAVGENVARHARPDTFKGGLLTVIVDNSTWMNQLAMLHETLLAQINGLLAAEKVKDLRFRLGNVAQGEGRAKPREAAPRRRKATESEKAAIEESLAPIRDAELKDKARRMLSASCSRKDQR